MELIGDVDHLNRIFVNLLSNAWKYINENGMIGVFLKEDKGVIHVTVEDNIKHNYN